MRTSRRTGHAGEFRGALGHLAAGVVALVHRLEPDPTYVKGRRWDVLAANGAARELFTDWDAMPPGERNLVRWMFTMQRAREVYVDWESEARAMLGRFRMAAARHPGDPDFTALIEQLHQESDLVREWWPGHDVRAVGSGSKKLPGTAPARSPRPAAANLSTAAVAVGDTSSTRPRRSGWACRIASSAES